MKQQKLQWKHIETGGNYILDDGNGKVYLSYQSNDFISNRFGYSELDSANPETAIVLLKDKKADHGMSERMKERYPDGLLPRYLIYRGDWREELEALYPDVEKLKQHWRENGGHFFSDGLDK